MAFEFYLKRFACSQTSHQQSRREKKTATTETATATSISEAQKKLRLYGLKN